MVFKYSLAKVYLIIILLLYQSNIIISSYISIPFKVYTEDTSGYISEDTIMSEFVSNKIYFPLQIGQPAQNVLGTINSLEFELLMKKDEFFIQKQNYEFNSEKSRTFLITEEKTLSNFDLYDSNYVKDEFYFCNKYDFNLKKCDFYNTYSLNFIYSKRSTLEGEEKNTYKWNEISFIEIGLNLKSHYRTKYSLYNNLFENKYISSNVWFLYYFPKNKTENLIEEEEGVLIYGEGPLKFLSKKYDSSKVAYSQGINQNYDYRDYWSLVFNEVKMKIPSSEEDIILGDNIQGVINHNYKAIIGSELYKEKIEENFFNNYLYKNLCEKKLLKNRFYYYVCNSNFLSFEKIKSSFPVLYFKQIDYNYIFELNADDLFVTRGDKIFFLVLFNKNNPTRSFLLGSIFLKKYFFYFDNDKNQIAFLQEIKDKEKVIILHWYNSPGTVIILIIIFCIIGVGGFYYGKKIYNKRKMRANELEDQFDYKGQSDKINNQFNLEMKLGI